MIVFGLGPSGALSLVPLGNEVGWLKRLAAFATVGVGYDRGDDRGV